MVDNYENSSVFRGALKVFSDILTILVLTFSIVIIDKKIKEKIRSLKDL